MRDKTRRRIRTAVVAGVVAAGGSIAVAAPALAATTPACKAANLTVKLGHVDAGAGQRYATLNFKNRGKTCVLRNGLTGVTFLKSGPEGGAQKVRTTVHHAAGSGKESIVLKHGKTGHLDLHWTVVSDKPITPDSLLFALPAHGGNTAASWRTLIGTASGKGAVLDLGHLHH
ncbi:DUF4232 domain-containing protein [Actinoallomurus rhizosphaericola]|uniref:DUF4232 domain-containing protein n=1 Tax=Actinoallomurus rhizosphaericola TaxID=2952536 RepID=UPI002093B168|nr:DUF4232 domain-containing protein [Actinoallomurus rhizosphaericola]MCO5997438.1 DUF4232 domain-containing protein [Actinoallomurus rhizosphaericola]